MTPLHQQRFTVGARIFDEVADLAAGVHVPDADGAAIADIGDLAELHVVAARPIRAGDPLREQREKEKAIASRVLAAVADGAVVYPAREEASLPNVNITLIRMGPVRAQGDEAEQLVDRYGSIDRIPEGLIAGLRPRLGEGPRGGYLRNRIGMGLADRPEQIWASARGYWRMAPDVDYLLPSRYGYLPYVFKADDWRTQRDGRVWAGEGWLIDPVAGLRRRLLETMSPENGWLPAVSEEAEPATDEDRRVAAIFAGRVIALGRRGPNPVHRLRRRSRTQPA